MPDVEHEPAAPSNDDFNVWINDQPQGAGQFGHRGAVIKAGPQVYKTVSKSIYGDDTTGEVKKRELRFRAHSRRRDGRPGWNFDEPDPKATWSCENEEIDRLLAFLHTDVAESGRYRVVDTESPAAALLDLLARSEVDVEELAGALLAKGDVGPLVGLLTASGAGLSAAEVAVLSARRHLVAELQALIREPSTSETDVQRLINDAYWLFGGRYVAVAERRNLVPLDQHDIPLLTADGTLHVVELKGPVIPKLIQKHRNHWIVGDDVHEAVGQAMNYLRWLDEAGAMLETMYRKELGQAYDMSRAFATVVIGHPDHVSNEGVDAELVRRTLRTYNAHLSRLQVITYEDLADDAERALVFEEATTKRASTRSPAPPVVDVADSDDPFVAATPPTTSSPWGDHWEGPPF